MDVLKLDKLLIRDCIIILAVILTGFTDMFLDTKSKPESTPSFQSKSESTPSVHAKQDDGTIHVEANLESISVLVNNLHKLPESYSPPDLICADIPFVFQEKTEKRKMRAEAAGAIKDLFIDAKAQGISLLGVSAYRSHATQTALFQSYVSKDGFEEAKTYSALPGTSEHETGLAIDVTGGDGKCPAQDCFGGTKEAIWLEENAADYGFIIRYPIGKKAITGYQYEPWHLRYVGKSIALKIMNKGITLEEYFHAELVSGGE
jgi:zinc D-Ala-D-Ala carboxypeptidase